MAVTGEPTACSTEGRVWAHAHHRDACPGADNVTWGSHRTAAQLRSLPPAPDTTRAAPPQPPEPSDRCPGYTVLVDNGLLARDN